VGAGAVQNAWAPVLRAIQPDFGFPLTADGGNCVLARMIYLLRWWSSVGDLGKEQLEAYKASLVELRTAICRELRLAQDRGELTVRPEFEKVVASLLVARSDSFILVTTNWDTVVPDALRTCLDKTKFGAVKPLHIHGSIARPDTLYLPTEVTREPYRSPQEDQEIGIVHSGILLGLQQAHYAVLYGLSLSPLDAELSQTLAVGWTNSNLKEISIVAPDHEAIAHRVNLLLIPYRKVIVKGYDPRDLTKGVDHSVKR
jgi:hypothetical protein